MKETQLELNLKSKTDTELLHEVLHFIRSNEDGDIDFIKYSINNLFLLNNKKRPFEK